MKRIICIIYFLVKIAIYSFVTKYGVIFEITQLLIITGDLRI